MKTGIVILNYNDSETTIELLERIKGYEALNIIAVVDNNSSDNSYNKLAKYENEKIKVLKSEKNNGYGSGNNIGCKYLAEHNMDHIIISNPDVIFSENDIINLIESFENENIAVVAPIIQEGETLNRGWKFTGAFIDGLTNINYIGRTFKKKALYEDSYYLDKYSKVDVVSGCFFVIRRDVMKEVGYFDENVFLYYEENILAKKIRKVDKDIIINNEVKVIHNHSVSVNKTYNKIKKFKILAKSQRYYHKNYNNGGAIKMLWLYITYAITLLISYILRIFGK